MGDWAFDLLIFLNNLALPHIQNNYTYDTSVIRAPESWKDQENEPGCR